MGIITPKLGKSKRAGKKHKDTMKFNDGKKIRNLVKQGKGVRVKRMKVFHDHQFVYGFEIDYEVYNDFNYTIFHSQYQEIHYGN